MEERKARKSPTHEMNYGGQNNQHPYNYGAPLPPGPPGHYYNHPPPNHPPPNHPPPNHPMMGGPPQQYQHPMYMQQQYGQWPQRSPPPQQPIFRQEHTRPSPSPPIQQYQSQWGGNMPYQRPPSPNYRSSPDYTNQNQDMCKSVNEDDSSKKDDKGRGSYRCGRCGVPKKGHVCPYQPKLKRRPEEGPPPDMKSISTQVEMDEHMILRRLNMEIQGYPESYISDVNDMVVGADSSNLNYGYNYQYEPNQSVIVSTSSFQAANEAISSSNGITDMERHAKMART